MRINTCHIRHMKQIINKIKTLVNQVRGLLPSALPTGVEAFNAWVQSIVDTYPLPTQDQDSIKFVFANEIMRLGPTVAFKPKFYFVLALKSAAAKQVAGAAFYEIKTKQQELEKEAKRKAAEATAQPVVSNGSTGSQSV